jgi:putative transposase
VDKRFIEEQIIGFMRDVEVGVPVWEMAPEHAFGGSFYYL